MGQKLGIQLQHVEHNCKGLKDSELSCIQYITQSAAVNISKKKMSTHDQNALLLNWYNSRTKTT